MEDSIASRIFIVISAISTIAFPIIGTLGTLFFLYILFTQKEASIVAHNIIEMSDPTSPLGRKVSSNIPISEYIDSIYERTLVAKNVSRYCVEASLEETSPGIKNEFLFLYN